MALRRIATSPKCCGSNCASSSASIRAQVPFGPQELGLNCSGACADPACSNQPGALAPWWVPLAYTTAAANGTAPAPARWLEMDSCSTGALRPHPHHAASSRCAPGTCSTVLSYSVWGLLRGFAGPHALRSVLHRIIGAQRHRSAV